MSEVLSVHTLGHEFRPPQTCVKTGCAGLNMNASHRLIYLNASSPLGRTVWEGLGGVALSEDMCH